MYSSASKFRKKPVVIEAIEFTGQNHDQCLDFIGAGGGGAATAHGDTVSISTLEGVMQATAGDFIIKDVKGEFYSCKPDIFEATYEAVEKEDIFEQTAGSSAK